MKQYDAEETDVLNYALNKICQVCTHETCADCTVYQVRSHFDQPQNPLASAPSHATYLPDSFLFQSTVNHLTYRDTYRARRDGSDYVISLPKIGTLCRLSEERMEACIRKHRFQLLPDICYNIENN